MTRLRLACLALLAALTLACADRPTISVRPAPWFGDVTVSLSDFSDGDCLLHYRAPNGTDVFVHHVKPLCTAAEEPTHAR